VSKKEEKPKPPPPPVPLPKPDPDLENFIERGGGKGKRLA